MGRIRRFLALSPGEQLLLVIAASLFVVFRITLRLGSLAANERGARLAARLGLSRWQPAQVGWAMTIVEANLGGSGSCLPAALVGLVLADLERIEVRFGVRETDGSLAAHAWLEGRDGTVLYAGENPDRFEPLDRHG